MVHQLIAGPLRCAATVAAIVAMAIAAAACAAPGTSSASATGSPTPQPTAPATVAASATPAPIATATATSMPAPSPTAATPTASPSTPTGATCVYRGMLPDPACTPGVADAAVTQANIDSTICVPGYASSVRPSSPADREFMYQLKKQEMRDYGVGDHSTGEFEQDHLIPLELGGAPRDPRNLWPEPFSGGDNAHDKDAIENGLHDAVCAGRVPLAAAQRAIAADWVGAAAQLLAPTPSAAVQPSPAVAGGCSAAAAVSNAAPARYATVVVSGRVECNGAPVSGLAMTATWHYKTTSPTCTATTAADGTASCSRSIGGASPGYQVTIDVCFAAPGGAACAQTDFTPH